MSVPTYTELLRRVEELEESEESASAVVSVLDEARSYFDVLNTALRPIVGDHRTENSPLVVDGVHDALEAFEVWLAAAERSA